MRKAIVVLFNLLFFLVPLVFYPRTSEVFEFNKLVLTYIITVAIAGFWLVRMISQKKVIFRRTILDIPLTIFLASQLISTLTSIDTRSSIFGYYSRFNGGLLSTISYLILYWAFVSNVTRDETKKLVNIVLASGFIVAIYGILEHFGGSISCLLLTGKMDDDCWVQDVRTRVFATLGQPNWMAAYLITLLPLAWALSLENWASKNKWMKFIYLALGALFFWAILYTKSRSGLIGLALAAAAFAACILIDKLKEKENVEKNILEKVKGILAPGIAIVLLIALAIGVSGTPWSPSISDVLNQKSISEQTAKLNSTSEGGTESGDIRKIVWKGAVNVWRAYPIFGSGPETFAFTYYMYRPVEHNLVSEWDFLYNKAHNQYLNFAANTGTFGLTSYLAVIGFSIYLMIRSLKTKQLEKNNKYLAIAVLAGYLSILVTNFFGFSVVIIDLLFFIAPALVVTTSSSSGKELEDARKKLSGGQKFSNTLTLLTVAYLIFIICRYWSADTSYAKAKAEIELGRIGNSVQDLNSAIKASPNEPLYHDKLAQVYAAVAAASSEEKDATSAGQLAAAAVSESDKALSLGPKNFIVLQDRVNIYSDLAQVKTDYFMESIKTLEYLVAYAPNYAKTYYKLGKAYLAIGQKEQGISEITKALQLKPNYADAKKALDDIKAQKSP